MKKLKLEMNEEALECTRTWQYKERRMVGTIIYRSRQGIKRSIRTD